MIHSDIYLNGKSRKLFIHDIMIKLAHSSNF